jgi:IgGFc binding protein/Secretion system C-terminal sorting domain/PKD-like domain
MLKLPYVFLLFLLFINSATSEVADVKNLTKYLSSSIAGTEFLFSFPPVHEEVVGGDNSLRILVVSSVRQEVTVELKAKGVKITKTTIPNEVVEFRISPSDGFPYSKSINSLAPPEKVYSQSAIQVKAQEPIIVYGVARYQYSADGFFAIPVSSFGTEYVIAAYPQYTAVGSTYDLPSLSNIIAAYDSTEVTFTMGGINGSLTTGGLSKGQRATVTMMRGDVWCFADAGDGQDISGSLVKSNKPIGVVSGNQCANVPSGVYGCDYMCEMELPTFTWGKEYHVTPIVGRQKAPVIRVFAKEKDTKVYRDGQDLMRLTLNSRGEGDAFIERRAFDGNLNDLVNQGGTPCKVISADKPIYVMLYNPGQTDDNLVSDPFQMVLTPLEHYQKEIVFATPNAQGSSLPFTRQFVNLVYENTPDGAIPDDLEFATVVNGKFTWKKVSVQFGPTPGFKFAIPVRGKVYSMKRLQLNGDGVFRIRSSSPFAAYAYGFSSYDSYGFPTSVSLNALDNQIKVSTIQKKMLCQGETFTVNYNTIGLYSISNVFSVELSDSNGSFWNKQIIGSLDSDKSGSIICHVPFDTPYGKNYKLRIRSSNPPCVSIEDTMSYWVDTSPSPSIQGSPTSCIDKAPLTYRTRYQGGQSYSWSKPRLGTIIGAINLDSVQIEWKASGQDTLILREFTIATGCFKDTSLIVTINPLPQPLISGRTELIEYSKNNVFSVTNESGSSYEWSVIEGDAEIEEKNGNSIELKVGKSGNVIIKVIQITADGCKNETQYNITVVSATRITELRSKSFSVYPNPNNGQEELIVELPSTSHHEVRIELIDLLGITRYEGMIPSQSVRHTIQLVDLPKGMYTIRLITRDGVLTEKVIVE